MKQPLLLAVRTGLEPATHGVTGRYSNQLNYRTNNFCSEERNLENRFSKALQI
jgi:hypothetical protein